MLIVSRPEGALRSARLSLTAALLFFALAASSGCHALFIRPRLVGETRVESVAYTLRTDLASDARRALLRVADEMRDELEIAFPAAPGAPPEDRRQIVAFASADDFRRFLEAHLFGEDRAIGFYCELGGEVALGWRDPPGPEDVRVLRHELVHQHLAARLCGRIPDWLEEGLAEAISLDGREFAAGWDRYRARRAAADVVFAALEVHAGARSWPAAEEAPAAAIPPPAWAAGEDGYSMHLLFIRFLESIGEGRERRGALGRTLAAAAAGADAPLDLARRFATLGALERAFHAYILDEGVRALVAGERDGAPAPTPWLLHISPQVTAGAPQRN